MKYTSNSVLFDATYNTAFSLFTQWLKFKLHNSIVCLQMFPKLSNIHTNTLFKRQTSTSYIIKNEYELAFLSTKSGFTLYYLSKETACKHVIIYITGFQTLPIMHNLHYLKNTYTLPHSNCEHIKNVFSLQPANQHNNSYKKKSCHGKYKTNVHYSLSLKRTQPNLSLCCL